MMPNNGLRTGVAIAIAVVVALGIGLGVLYLPLGANSAGRVSGSSLAPNGVLLTA
jgi:hypothetical protein